jgi:hypothetical protein
MKIKRFRFSRIKRFLSFLWGFSNLRFEHQSKVGLTKTKRMAENYGRHWRPNSESTQPIPAKTYGFQFVAWTIASVFWGAILLRWWYALTFVGTFYLFIFFLYTPGAFPKYQAPLYFCTKGLRLFSKSRSGFDPHKQWAVAEKYSDWCHGSKSVYGDQGQAHRQTVQSKTESLETSLLSYLQTFWDINRMVRELSIERLPRFRICMDQLAVMIDYIQTAEAIAVGMQLGYERIQVISQREVSVPR